jgi:tetratricopeptide (TPR) repeat protein
MARTRLVCWMLVLVTLVLFAQVRSYEFVEYDDPEYVMENQNVKNGFTKEGLAWAFGKVHGESTYWHPLTWMSHMLDCQLFGMNAGAHHLVSVFLHALNAALLFLVLQQMTGAFWRSAMVAALFAWHPLQVDSVAWIAERKNVLSGLFWIVAMGAYIHYARRPGVGRYLLVLLGCALGLMCKPILVVLPCALLLLDFWPLRRWPWARLWAAQGFAEERKSSPRFPPATSAKLILEKVPLFLLGVVSSYITVVAHRELGSTSASEAMPFYYRVGNALVSYVRYLGKAIWPEGLCVFYPHPGAWPEGQVAASAALLLGVTLLVLWKMRRAPYAPVGWFWFLGVLVPYIGLVQAGLQAMADRFAYLPLIGLFVLVVWSAADLTAAWPRRQAVVSVLAGAVLLACGAMTWTQLGYWQNSVMLFTHAVAVTTNNAPAHINLGVALEKEGRQEEALLHYQEALRIRPSQPQVHNNLGNLLAAMGRTDEAIVHYQRALQLRPGVALVHLNFGLTLAGQGKLDEATAHFAEAIRLRPADPEPHFAMAKALLAQDKPEQAIEHLRAALRLDPDHIKSLMQLARLLAANEIATLRNGAEAVRLAQRANHLTGGQHPGVLDTLAMAYAEAGRFEDAARAAQQALDLLNAIEQKDLAAEVRARLQLYQAGKPYRESCTNVASRFPKS